MKNIIIILLVTLSFVSIKSQNEYGEFVKNSNINVRVVSLDASIDSSRLVEVSSFINEFFGFKTEIRNDSIDITEYLFGKSEYVNADLFTMNVYQDTFTIYLTNRLLTTPTNLMVSGATVEENLVTIVCNRISFEYIKGTIIHEFGHLLGLGHCENSYCVMSIESDEQSQNKFCSHCSNYLKH